LSASIAHEFNNPLFGIRSVLEGVKMRGSFDKEDSELLALGIRECNRIKDLIVSLQEFNRPTSGEMKPMSIQQAIEDMLLLCKKEFKIRKIKVEECYTSDLAEIQAVEDQIKQVILNLLKNAEEAIPEEGGIIKISTKSFKKKVAIQIHDSGVGIKAKDKNKIFDPFYSTKSSVKGAGLGLSVSYGIIKRHGGVVNVESKPNKGTAFTVILPMKGRI
jgi:signal transduction histidine kinase